MWQLFQNHWTLNTNLLKSFSPKRDSHLRKIREEEYYENEQNCSSKFTTLRLFSGTSEL